MGVHSRRKGGVRVQRHRRLVAASCRIWLLTVVALVSCQNAPDVAGLRSLATEGDATAQFDLGDRYFKGEGVPQDNGEAIRWFRLAAEQGHAGAQFNLGLMYANGRGIPQDDGEAARWYRLAAEQGHAGGQFTLSLMYGAGRGVPQDYVAAHEWANLAAAQGHENAREMRETFAEAMSATERTAREERIVDETLGYTLLDETLDESPGKTQVTMNIVVPESATDRELTALLSQLLQGASQRTAFRYHKHPTVVGIYAYASREHAESGMGQWEAMVAKTPLDPEPSVRIRLGRGTVEEPANRFGLNRQERMATYGQLVGAEDRGNAEAQREFPTDLRRQFERADQLGKQYKQDLAVELGITRDQLDEIGVEGLQQNWPMPAPFSPSARMRVIEQGIKQEYEAALARFTAAAGAAERGDGTWADALAEGETVLALATAMEAEMSAISTEMAAAAATAPPEVAARVAPQQMAFEQAVREMESVVVGLQAQVELMRALAAELEQLTR